MAIRAALLLRVLAAITDADDPGTLTITGTVVGIAAPERDAQGDTFGTVEVKHARGRLLLIVTAKTTIEKAVDAGRRACVLAGLRPGDRVEAVCSPEFAASEPPQTVARRLIVLPPGN